MTNASLKEKKHKNILSIIEKKLPYAREVKMKIKTNLHHHSHRVQDQDRL